MAAELTNEAPYGTGDGIVKVMETFRETGLGGAPVTTELVMRLSMGQEVARRVVLSLRLLDLIDKDGVPTPSLVAFKQAPHDGYRQLFANHLLDVYAPVFAILGRDLSSKTTAQVEDAFRNFRPDSVRGRMVSCFLVLCKYAGLIEAGPAHAKAPRPPAGRGAAPRRTTPPPLPAPPQPPPFRPPTTDPLVEAKKRYLDILLTRAAEAEAPDQDLLDRIERALGIAGGGAAKQASTE